MAGDGPRMPRVMQEISPPRIENASGKAIVIRGWNGTALNHINRFTAEFFSRAVTEYLARKGFEVDTIWINGFLPVMGAAERQASRTGRKEKCLFIPERLLELDPGLKGLNNGPPRFTMATVDGAPFISRARIGRIIAEVHQRRGSHKTTDKKMETALRMRYGIEKENRFASPQEIAEKLRVTKQAVSYIINKAEYFLRHFPTLKAELQEMRQAFSGLIGWLMGEEYNHLPLAELKRSMVDLGLVEKGEEDCILPALQMNIHLSSGALRYQINHKQDYLFIPFRPRRFAGAAAQNTHEAEAIASLIRKRGPLHIFHIASLRRRSPHAIRQIIHHSNQFVHIGRGSWGLSEQSPDPKKIK